MTNLPQSIVQLENPELSVVIPVYNEDQNLVPLHEELTAVLGTLKRSYELIFVDDGSSDTSFDVLQNLHACDPQVKVIQFRRNFGQTAAFAAGFEHASGKVIITLDADGQNNPAYIPEMLEKMEGGDYDLVTGWRINRREPGLRRLLSTTANRLISRSTGIFIHDRGCSLKLYRSELVKHMRLYGQQHRFLPELASAVGARVVEIPIQDRQRRYGRSKYGSISRLPRVLLDLITVFFLLSFFTSPMRFFGTIALVSTLSGIFIGGWLSLAKIYHGLAEGWPGFHAYQIGSRPIFLLAILLILVGMQFLMMGLLGEMIMRTYFEARGKPTYYVRKVLD